MHSHLTFKRSEGNLMYKETIELFKVNNLKVKFSLPILGDEDQKYHTELIKKIQMGNNSFLKINPRPQIVLEITIPGKPWDPSSTIVFPKPYFYIFVRKLKTFIDDFQIPNLYRYVNHKLTVNTEIASNRFLLMNVGNRACKMMYSVVLDDNNKEVEYEGCILKINHDLNYILLTYEEILMLYDELSHIDVNTLSLQAIQLAQTFQSMKTNEIRDYEVAPQNTDHVEVRGYNLPMNQNHLPSL